MLTPEAFLARIERYLSHSAMTPTAFGKSAVRDPNFVFDLRKGRVPNLALADQVNEFMKANPPAPAPAAKAVA